MHRLYDCCLTSFNKFKLPCKPDTYQDAGTASWPQDIPSCPLQSIRHRPPEAASFVSNIFIDLSGLFGNFIIQTERNSMVLASVVQHGAFDIHPCCVNQQFSLLYIWLVAGLTNIMQFHFLSISLLMNTWSFPV